MRRERATGILHRDGAVLLMYRRKQGREYYVVPGGGIEDGETPEQACRREFEEETGLAVSDIQPLTVLDTSYNVEHVFLVVSKDTELRIRGPEENRQSAENVYRLEWVPLDKIPSLELVPEELKATLASDIQAV